MSEAAADYRASKFLLVSTDKAVHPTSVMGATKRVCEMYAQAHGNLGNTEFLAVRFGNVLASDGSVVPVFMEQIRRGGPITVTHPEMRRYFMTIPEAVTLILQAAAMGKSGQIMVLEMGEPIKIVDLARQLLSLTGKDKENIPIQYIGFRPGEKLFEETNFNDENYLATAHSKIKIYDRKISEPEQVVTDIYFAFNVASGCNDPEHIKRILKRLVPEYSY
jgi:FlaA1/EpsC-like NDP-sugar epimerase